MRFKSDPVRAADAGETSQSAAVSHAADSRLTKLVVPFGGAAGRQMPADEADLSISQMADAFHVTMRTLRFYEEKGLLSPRRVGNRRFYSEACCARLRLIVKGKAMGFGLDEIAELVAIVESNRSDDKRAALLRELCERQREHLVERRSALDEQIEATDAVIDGLMTL